ncbi:MAG: energy transducer TonB [Humidesulfovibrio sp.]|uniref:energy transducer TonB n=1 Tax=Humidesulfovibrio sp. TaxID=2910988 RepID=UPI0027EB85E5|nr:energy transducer TonB [Humidesulfovibrio sp.]MDQ7836276.1 energy transducer TonB [Humidesulfovibrio sp.]
MPVAVKRVKPFYPMDARRRGISGQVTLRLFVDAEGGVREVQVQAAEPAGVFEEKAVEAARKWRFEPAVFKGAPVGIWMTLPVRFALDGR